MSKNVRRERESAAEVWATVIVEMTRGSQLDCKVDLKIEFLVKDRYIDLG